MKYALLGAALLLPMPALAWVTKPDPAPATTSTAASASRAAASARQSTRTAQTTDVTVQNTVAPARGSGGAGRGAGGSGNNNAAPALLAPSIVGGNPCTVGVSLGGVGQNAGGMLGWSWESHECSLRQTAAILANLGLEQQAIETLCRSNNDVRWALRNAGTPCADDVERWKKEGWRP